MAYQHREPIEVERTWARTGRLKLKSVFNLFEKLNDEFFMASIWARRSNLYWKRLEMPQRFFGHEIASRYLFSED